MNNELKELGKSIKEMFPNTDIRENDIYVRIKSSKFRIYQGLNPNKNTDVNMYSCKVVLEDVCNSINAVEPGTLSHIERFFKNIKDSKDFNKKQKFLNPFQGLDFCRRNIMKAIEVEYKGKILLFRFNEKMQLEEKYLKDAHLSGIIINSWCVVDDIYPQDMEKNWTNIKEC